MNIQVNDNNSINLSLANSSTTLTADDSELKHIEVGDASAVSLSVASVAEIPLVAGDTTAILPDPYTGSYEVTPKAYEEQILQTANKTMAQNVTVHEVPYYETPNTDGDTVYIASEV